MAECLYWILIVMIMVHLGGCMASEIGLGSRLVASDDNQNWVSDNGTFAFGFSPAGSDDRFQLAIWFNQLPGDRIVIWSPNRHSPVSKGATVSLNPNGNLVLVDENTIVWISNTSNQGITVASMSESGNFILYNTTYYPKWQSFSHPSNTLLPNQPLKASLELTSSQSSGNSGYYTLKMLQHSTSLSLALTYNLPESLGLYDEHRLELYTNYSYWAGPDISNVTGEVVAVLDDTGSFGITYGDSSNGAVYVYKNDLGLSVNQSQTILRRLTLETNGNLRLYRWDDDVNGSRTWVAEWAAVSNPCEIAGICGNGICNLDKTKTNATCTCLPNSYRQENSEKCLQNSSVYEKCDKKNGSFTSDYKVSAVQNTNYNFYKSPLVANYSDISNVSKCGDVCLSDCECVASVYGLDEEKPYCWVLTSLDFGGFEDAGSTLFVKNFGSNGSFSPFPKNNTESDDSSKKVHEKALIIPIVVTMGFLVGLLCILLYYSIHRRKKLKKAYENSVIVSGSPMNFMYRDLQSSTCNFSQVVGQGGFGSVYKGTLGDGTLIAVKKLDRVLPQGEKEFITEVKTIGSMHHMNLVRLCGYCSEGSHRLLVYEYMKNGSLDKWIFSSLNNQNKLLDWKTRFNIATSTAQGIAYFHEHCRNRIIHCDIKPENILLDEDFCPKVSDFGLAKLMGRENSHVVTMVRGTRGYLAPEWVSNRPITVKADVYSYGMLLLEIVGGRRNLDMSFDSEEFFYPGLAYKEMTKGTPIKAADKRLNGEVDEEELKRAIQVGFWCIQDEVFMRPTMGEVVKMLEGTVEVNEPPMPQTVMELIEEGLDHVYKTMKRDLNHFSSFTVDHQSASRATCSYSTMSPR